MSDSGVALVNTTEFCGNHFTTRIAKNDDTHNQTVIRDLYNKFKLLQLSLTERIRETRSELNRIVYLREVTGDNRNSSIAAARAGKRIERISIILEGLSKVIDRRAEIDSSASLDSWIDLRAKYVEHLKELREVQLREAGLNIPLPAQNCAEDNLWRGNSNTASVMDSTLSATDSATMRNSPLCPSTVIPFLEDKVPARLDEIKNQIHDDMNHIGKGIGTLKAIAVDLGMELDEHNRAITNSKKLAFETNDTIDSKNKSLSNISYKLLSGSGILFSRTLQLAISGISLAIIFFIYRFTT